MTDLKHLCFDKDGVIIDVHAYWVHTTKIRANYLKNHFKLSASQENDLVHIMGVDISLSKIRNNGPIGYEPREVIILQVVNQLLKYSIKVTFSELANLFVSIDEYQQKSKDYDIKLLKGVPEFLEKNKNKYVMSIFTSDRKKNAEMALEEFGIKKYFKEILGGDSVSFPKPNPDGIYKACEKVGFKENETAYISDTSSDLIMAENAKVFLKIGVLTGLGHRNELIGNGDLICKDFFELSNSLQ
jgi:phosphoglycolate phosphatase